MRNSENKNARRTKEKMNTEKKEKTEVKLFDAVHEIESGSKKAARRKLCEALRRLTSWFNKELKVEEVIPKEFEDYVESDHERFRRIWGRFL